MLSLRGVRRAALALLLLLGLFAAAITGMVRGSLPALEGERAVAVAAPVDVERDARGTVTLRGSSRLDLAHATGWVHAQDRYFQMDLLRRSAAGELAELVGSAALPLDRERRLHDFRARAEQALKGLSAAERELLERYVQGVNAGLQDLSARPFEYWLLRQKPKAWTPADTLLVVYAMYLDLQDGQFEMLRERLRAEGLLSPEQQRFWWAAGLQGLEAPLDGDTAYAEPAPLPPPPAWWGRGGLKQAAASAEPQTFGSNAWAVARLGQPAMVANDMHLNLGLPNIWYRLALHWQDESGARRAVGLTLPGAPALVVGSTGRIAWGFTNAYVQTQELKVLSAAEQQQIRRQRHELRRSDGDAEVLEAEVSPWGPVRRIAGQVLAQTWRAHAPGAVNLRLLALEQAANVDAALRLAPELGLPTQNQVVVDAQGHLAWTAAGPLQGAPHPVVRDPEGGVIWSANQRHLGGAGFAALGDGGYGAPGRAWRIQQRLQKFQQPDEAALADIALDDHAPVLARWRAVLLRALGEGALESQRSEYRRLLGSDHSIARARPEAVDYTLLKGFRQAVLREFQAQFSQALGADFNLARASPRWDEAALRLLEQQPEAWALASSWRAWILSQVDAEILRLRQAHGELAQAHWGQSDSIQVRHPLSRALPPWLGRHLDAPPQPMVGDGLSPRAQAKNFGASERLVVAPGREEQGLFAMPGGPSGHPLSPFYLSDHADWAAGRFGPLLPGAVQHRLRLDPAQRPTQRAN
ncbi:penicillin amidase [Inhella inkyongensis]|uniref:Penicillin amidase n=1 Tax=Inhella inkyongensis TaxID=392593 RepID=A0A840SBZ2_9BURK|nr:penicillin acylase family protein [Inhella inkyongensis]MBB5206284.1 penicillin amidase [Inhella inkyongensis]